jgi:hypothetical protein
MLILTCPPSNRSKVCKCISERFEVWGRVVGELTRDFLYSKRKEVQEGKDPIALKKIGNHLFKELAEHYRAWAERQLCFRTKSGFISQAHVHKGRRMGDGRRRDTEESAPCKAAPGKQQAPPLGVANSPEKVARLARLERAASCLEGASVRRVRHCISSVFSRLGSSPSGQEVPVCDRK